MGSREGVNRIYVGNLPVGIEDKEVLREFGRFGKIVNSEIKRTVSGAPFAFIEYDDPRDAQDAIKERDGCDFDGSRLRVEVPFNARDGSRRGSNRMGRNRGQPPRRGRYVVEVLNLPPSGSWQDLKDHVREAGECGHADVFRDGTGEVSFFTRRDLEAAIDMFDGTIFRSHEGEKGRIQLREKIISPDDGRRYESRGRSRSHDRYRSHSRGRHDRRRRSYSRGRSRERERRPRYSRSISPSYER